MDLGFPDVTSGKESACQGRRHKRPKFTPLRRAWQTTPVFLTGESHGQRSLVNYGPWLRYRSWSALKPALCNKRSRCSEKPARHNWRVDPARHNCRKARAATKTQHSQNNKHILKITAVCACARERDGEKSQCSKILVISESWKTPFGSLLYYSFGRFKIFST